MTERHSLDRRRFLGSGAVALGGITLFGARPAFGRSPFRPDDEEGEGPILVVLQLAGGNDGLNTIVPYREDPYYAARKVLSVPSGKVLPIDDYRGFNPLLGGLREVWDRGELAIVEGAGYPNPNRSHFASFDIWHAAHVRGKAGGDGWMARLASTLRSGGESDVNLAVHVGDRLPYSLYSAENPGVCFNDPNLYRWNRDETAICDVADESGMMRARDTFLQARSSSAAIREAAGSYTPRVSYPDTQLAHSLEVVAALIQAGIGSRVLSVELAGFDTHAKQPGRHDGLLRTFDRSLTAFLDDLRGTPAGDRTAVLVFSEFGRRVAENASKGTDHGTAGPMFVAGPRVKGGLYGAHPSLTELDQGDLVYTTDFRSVYASIVEGWFGGDAEAVLGASFPTLPLFA